MLNKIWGKIYFYIILNLQKSFQDSRKNSSFRFTYCSHLLYVSFSLSTHTHTHTNTHTMQYFLFTSTGRRKISLHSPVLMQPCKTVLADYWWCLMKIFRGTVISTNLVSDQIKSGPNWTHCLWKYKIQLFNWDSLPWKMAFAGLWLGLESAGQVI